MTHQELRRQVRDLFRYRFAATPYEVADALGIDSLRAAALCAELHHKVVPFPPRRRSHTPVAESD